MREPPFISSTWYPEYREDWIAAHPSTAHECKGHFRKGAHSGTAYWVTDTPAFDSGWFAARRWSMPRPWRMLGAVEPEWIDHGDGIKQLGVAEQHTS